MGCVRWVSFSFFVLGYLERYEMTALTLTLLKASLASWFNALMGITRMYDVVSWGL